MDALNNRVACFIPYPPDWTLMLFTNLPFVWHMYVEQATTLFS